MRTRVSAAAAGGTSISWRTKLASPVPLFVTSRVTDCEPPGLTIADRGRGLASRSPAASAKSRRTTVSGVIVALFVSEVWRSASASKSCEPLPAAKSV